jgi:Tfp pilus assembly protein PilX
VARKAAALRDASAAMQAAGAAFVQKEQQLEEAKEAKVRIPTLLRQHCRMACSTLDVQHFNNSYHMQHLLLPGRDGIIG